MISPLLSKLERKSEALRVLVNEKRWLILEVEAKVLDKVLNHETCSTNVELEPTEPLRDLNNEACSAKTEPEPSESVKDRKNEGCPM